MCIYIFFFFFKSTREEQLDDKNKREIIQLFDVAVVAIGDRIGAIPGQ